MNPLQHELLDQLHTTDEDDSNIFALDVGTQHEFFSMYNRNLLSLPEFSGADVPYEPFAVKQQDTGRLFPVWSLHAHRRQLDGFIVEKDTELYRQLDRVRQDAEIEDEHVFIIAMFNDWEVQLVQGQIYHKVANQVNVQNQFGWYPNAAIPANTQAIDAPAVAARAQFENVANGEVARHYLIFSKNAIDLGPVAEYAVDGQADGTDQLTISEEAKMIRAYTQNPNVQFPAAAVQYDSFTFTKEASLNGAGANEFAINDQATLDDYKLGQYRIFKEPIKHGLGPLRSKRLFVPSQDDFKTVDDADDIYTEGARLDFRLDHVRSFTELVYTVSDNFWDHHCSSISAAGVDILYPAIVQYRDYLVDDPLFAILVAGPGFDPLYFDIHRALTFNTRLYGLPDDYFRREEPAVRSLIQVKRKEPLLDFCGMGICRPHRFFPTMESYPGFIQDFQVRTQFKSLTKEARLFPDFPRYTAELSQTGTTYIHTRSKDGFDQATKELQKADLQYPFLERTSTTFSVVQDIKTLNDAKFAKHFCEFETNKGPPDGVFLYLEREAVKGAPHTVNQPRITRIGFEVFEEDLKNISDVYDHEPVAGELFDVNHLYQAIRRNSNYRANTVENVEQRGGVLLLREDFGNWHVWQQKLHVDNFKGRFVVMFESGSRDRSVSAAVDSDLKAQRVKLNIVFIYERYGLEGTKFNNRFRLL